MTITPEAGTSVPATGRPAGRYDRLDIAEYHRDPALSSSGARRLLAPGCPALYRWEADNGRAPRPEFDFGHAAHLAVLGDGPELVVVEAPDWRSKDARAQRDEAYEVGAVPVLAAEYERVQAMADQIRRHPVASALFAPGSGRPEVSLFWQDDRTGVMCRARPDWLPDAPQSGGRLIIPDYKTCLALDDDAVQRAIHTYGYHQQSDWYETGARAVLGVPDVVMVLVMQLKVAPFLVRVVQPDALAMRIAAARSRRAIEIYAECTASGRWPGYGDDVTTVPLPVWAERNDTEEYL